MKHPACRPGSGALRAGTWHCSASLGLGTSPEQPPWGKDTIGALGPECQARGRVPQCIWQRPCTQAWRDCTLSLCMHTSCLNHRPNDFRFFPIFLYYYLSLFLLQFSDHELLNVCLLSNSLLPPRHTAACVGRPPAPAPGPSCCPGTPHHAQHMAGPHTLPGLRARGHTGSGASKRPFCGSNTALPGFLAMGALAGAWGALGCTGMFAVSDLGAALTGMRGFAQHPSLLSRTQCPSMGRDMLVIIVLPWW